MAFEIMPLTEAGRGFTALAEEHARDFATRAEQHDREGSFPVENIEALRRSGASGATVPSELGGLGVDSIHDYMVGVNRLGRGGWLDRTRRQHAHLSHLVHRESVASGSGHRCR